MNIYIYILNFLRQARRPSEWWPQGILMCTLGG